MYKTAFEVAQLHGFKGTKEEWLAKLQGPEEDGDKMVIGYKLNEVLEKDLTPGKLNTPVPSIDLIMSARSKALRDPDFDVDEDGDITCRIMEADKLTRDGRSYSRGSLEKLTMKREYMFPPVVLTEEQEELMRNARMSMRNARFSVPVNPHVSRSLIHLDLGNTKNLDPNDIYAGISRGQMPDFRIVGVEPVWDPKAKHYTLVPKLEKFESNFNPHTPYFYHECGHFIMQRQMRIEKELKQKTASMLVGAASQYTLKAISDRRGDGYYPVETDFDSAFFQAQHWIYKFSSAGIRKYDVPRDVIEGIDTNIPEQDSKVAEVFAPHKRVSIPLFHPWFGKGLPKLK